MALDLAPLPVQWPAIDALLEASGNGPSARVARAARVAAEIVRDFRRLEGETAAQLLARLERLKRELLAAVGVGLIDATPATIDRLLRDVDTLIATATTEILSAAARPFASALVLGEQAGTQPVRALQIRLPSVFMGRGADDTLVRTAEDNALDLLTPPMRQFASDIRTSIRRVAVAGGQRMEEIQRLQKSIAERGLDQAAFRAERIVRTELGRVFGEATFARLEDLAKTLAFLKKAWKATNDRRTRLGHREAGQTYGRGKGIPIAERFQVPVYEERGKAGPKRIGVAALRFPIDPLTTPAGRLAAASTILCRCHAVVDVDVARYAEFARAQVQFALGGPPPPPPPPPPPAAPPPPPPPPPAPRQVKPPRVTARATPRRFPSTRIATDRDAQTSIAQKLQIPTGRRWNPIRSAMNAVDFVHGDGPLRALPLRYMDLGPRHLGGYAKDGSFMVLTPPGLRQTPHMTLWHETGHWIDHAGLGRNGLMATTAVAPELAAWRDAVENSTAITTMRGWQVRQSPRPPAVSDGHLTYLLEPEEIFARSYAQYIALRSGHPVGRVELGRKLQAFTSGWYPYPEQWAPDDFTAIAAAFDALFAARGWRQGYTGP